MKTVKSFLREATYQGKQVRVVKHNMNAEHPYIIVTAGLGIKIKLPPSQVDIVLKLEDGKMTQVKEDHGMNFWFITRKGNVLDFTQGDERLKIKVNRNKLT